MALKNFHDKPFDEGTQTKLSMFGGYIRAWLPVWISLSRPGTQITIVDYFAGPGRDRNGMAGSPLIALAQIRALADLIQKKRATIYLEFNELATRKAATLRKILKSEDLPSDHCRYRIRSLDFQDAFDVIYPRLADGPNLLFFDQQGMKAISESVFNQIVALPRTDFLFFIASSSLRRFLGHPHLGDLRIPPGRISSATFNHTHRAVAESYRQLAARHGTLYLGKFSIKKGSNVYGLIFGSHHPLGLEKFLRICWQTDTSLGEANFDIDDDLLDPTAPHLFSEMDRPKKLDLFESELRSKILSGVLNTDGKVYIESMVEGFLPKHGRSVLRELIDQGKVTVRGGQPRVSMNGFKQPRKLEVISNG